MFLISDFFQIIDFVHKNESEMNKHLSELHSSFTMHRSGGNKQKENKKKTSSAAEPTFTAVHSLKLHLQAMLKR